MSNNLAVTTLGASALTLTTPLSVANGGTGAATLTSGGILLGADTGAITASSNLTFIGSALSVTGSVTATGHITTNGVGAFIGINETGPAVPLHISTTNTACQIYLEGDTENGAPTEDGEPIIWMTQDDRSFGARIGYNQLALDSNSFSITIGGWDSDPGTDWSQTPHFIIRTQAKWTTKGATGTVPPAITTDGTIALDIAPIGFITLGDSTLSADLKRRDYLRFNNYGSYGINAASSLYVGQNIYYNATDNLLKYFSTAVGFYTTMVSGAMNFISVPSGTLDTTITSNIRMTINNNGQITMPANIGATNTTSGTLVVTGGVGISEKLYTAGLTVGAYSFGTNSTDTSYIVSSGIVLLRAAVASGAYIDTDTGFHVRTLAALEKFGIDNTTTPGAVTTGQWTATAIASAYGGLGTNASGFSGAVSAASGVFSAGTLSVANGGTGATTLTSGGVLIGNTTGAITAGGTVTSGTWQGSVIIGTYGGTGLSSFGAANNIPYAASTTALTASTNLTFSGSALSVTGSITATGHITTNGAGAFIGINETIPTVPLHISTEDTKCQIFLEGDTDNVDGEDGEPAIWMTQDNRALGVRLGYNQAAPDDNSFSITMGGFTGSQTTPHFVIRMSSIWATRGNAGDAPPTITTDGDIAFDIYPTGQVRMPANITSTNTTSGTLVVTGGVGVSETLNATSLALTNPLPGSSGGTGLSTFTAANRIPYAASTTALTTDDNLTFDGNTFIAKNDATGGGIGVFYTTNTGYTNSVIVHAEAVRAATDAYEFFRGSSSFGAGTDIEARIKGDGNATIDGTWAGGGADYSEYFELNTPADGENDIRGYTVIMVGAKVSLSSSDANATVVGVVRDKSGGSVSSGNAAELRYHAKYLKNVYGAYILDANGERQLSPTFDPNAVYVPRAQRIEWQPIGLVGQIAVRKGQRVNTNWIMMQETIDANHDLYLVR